MTDVIDIAVGSDTGERTKLAEATLEHSIRSRTDATVNISFLRWDWGRTAGRHTNFSLFRFCIPEAREYKGRVLYLDVDMIVLGDIAELWAIEQRKPWVCGVRQPNEDGKVKTKTEVSLIACNDFRTLKGWPKVKDIKTSPGVYAMVKKLKDLQALHEGIPPEWNCLDGRGYEEGKTKLVHYTNMRTQPWHPYPGRYEYSRFKHRDPRMVELWNKECEAAHANALDKEEFRC